MADTIEKVYCTGDGGNDNLAAALLARGRDNDPATMLAAIQDVGGKVGFSAERVINAANLGNLNIIQQLKDCCCTTQQNINRMGYENQLGQKDIINAMQQGFCYTNTGLERGFSNLGNLIQTVVCDLKNSGKDNTQRIVDVLNNHWEQDLRIQLEDSKRREQTGFIIQQLKTTTTTTGA